MRRQVQQGDLLQVGWNLRWTPEEEAAAVRGVPQVLREFAGAGTLGGLRLAPPAL